VAKKIKMSNGDLTAILYEEIKQAADCPMGTRRYRAGRSTRLEGVDDPGATKKIPGLRQAR
jgi:hypothetical protein